MPATKKSTRRSHTVPKKTNTPSGTRKEPVAITIPKATWWQKIISPFVRAWQWRRGLEPRTPHRSFRRTRRRDYVRSLELPGYFAFTRGVWRTLWRYKTTFGLLVVIYALLSALLVGMASQSTYTQLSDLLRTTSGDIFQGNVGKVGQAGLLLITGLSGGMNPSLSDTQQLIAGILVLMMWLTTVWLLRAFLAGSTPRLRDGLYNSGAPIIPTFLLGIVLLIQLIPAAIAVVGVSSAMPTGLLSDGVEAMIFWVFVLLLILLSLYWITSTLVALVVVTLPGVYPFHALKTANELVVGRRFRIVLRLVWLMALLLFVWIVVLVPIILLDAWLKSGVPAIEWLPIVPFSLLIASSLSVVWTASYVYLLYRKVVDDDAAPA